MTDDIRDAAISFEAIKTSLRQNKDGVALTLVVHPDDCPPELFRTWVGARFYVAMVELGEDEQPKISDAAMERMRAIQSAGMLCRSEAFYKFLVARGYADDAPLVDQEANAAEAMRRLLGIQTRSEMKTDDDAYNSFMLLRDDFLKWIKSN